MRFIWAALVFGAPLARCASQVPPTRDDVWVNKRQDKVITEELSSYIQGQLQAGNVTGLSVGIVLPGGNVEFGTWGNHTEAGDAVTPGTIFNLGSCSKAFLSASLGILMQDFEDGKNQTALPGPVAKFSWYSKVRDLLPEEWQVEDEWATEKTDLRDLLSHVTGLPAHDLAYAPDESSRDVVLRMRHLRAAYELRQHYEYSNQMYIAGAHVVSRYAGMPYRDFVEKRILSPLGMASSTLHPDRAFATGKFTQFFMPSGRRIPFFTREQTADMIAGPAGVMSTAEDMTLWMKMLLNGGVDGPTNTTIVPRATVDLATSAISVMLDKGPGPTFSIAGYGLGWIRVAYRGHELIQHAGGAPGVATQVDLYPYDGFGIVVLANTRATTAGATSNIASAIADRLFGLPVARDAARAAAVPGPNVARDVPRPLTPADSTVVRGGAQCPAAVPERKERKAPRDVPTPPTPADYTGTYSNAGYGNVTLCSPASTSAHCLQVMQAFGKVAAATGRPTPATDLFAAWPRFWGSHLRLYPYSGASYVVEATNLYVGGYGANTTAFEDATPAAVASFMMEEGRVVGLGMTVALGESWRAKRGGSIRDVSDVWFEKLE
ncbi:beta-lactamase/transpeptidase-like protein [Mycena belliarum]|uniref:Beta-lactamase/transpeptidase-like protein n=1 Tax=Mycena belliarum TaxID=1033014 RepID=A0AAD6XV29_9AGAR|nr:beta-lactamase/transpeptidase-like protein [Mycena belliae]